MIIASIAIVTFFLIVSGYKVLYEATPVERHGDPLELRGVNMLALRTPEQTAFEKITIQEDGRASRLPIPFDNAMQSPTRIQLSADEQRAMVAQVVKTPV